MEDVIAILMVFGLPMYFVKRMFDLRERKLLNKSSPERDAELEGLREERKLLQGRVENLEAIVCDVDHELNMQIRQLVQRTGAQQVLANPDPPLPEQQQASENVEPETGIRQALTQTMADDRMSPRRAAQASPSQELVVGSVVENRYRIQRLLGRGGMGAVYLADDEVLGESVALKVISWAWAHDRAETVERFRREASAARRVSSANVIRIHDLGETRAGLLFISMEFFPGKTLADLLEARGCLSAEETKDIVGQICDGLDAAHRAGVVHRDLKPQNVLVGERNAVKLIDFGLAKASYMKGMTATGLIMGTPEYMSPEQVKGLEVDARSDIYSLAALVYHAATGQPPFRGATPIAVGFAHLSETPRPPREVKPELSEKLSAAIVRGLAKAPADRPQSVAEFRKAL